LPLLLLLSFVLKMKKMCDTKKTQLGKKEKQRRGQESTKRKRRREEERREEKKQQTSKLEVILRFEITQRSS